MYETKNFTGDPLLDSADTYRHWHPQSEQFTSGEAFMRALCAGWKICGVIFGQDFWYGEGRRVRVYHFKLERNGETVQMSVVQNPHITHFIAQGNHKIVQLNHRKESHYSSR